VVISDGKTTDTSVDNVPPTNPDVGDTFYELTTQRFYVYDGSTWVTLTGGTAGAADTHSFTGLAAPTISLRPDGTALVAGDQFVNTAIPELFVWTGALWTSIAGGSSTAGSIITSPVPPAVGQEGDTYYNTTDDTLYVSNGTIWEPVDSGDTHSFTGAGAPTLTTRPDGSALQAGDQYIDSNTEALYSYDGAAWNRTTALAVQAYSDVLFDGGSAPYTVPDTTASGSAIMVSTTNGGVIYLPDITAGNLPIGYFIDLVTFHDEPLAISTTVEPANGSGQTFMNRDSASNLYTSIEIGTGVKGHGLHRFIVRDLGGGGRWLYGS
jgi:hypothetical protein